MRGHSAAIQFKRLGSSQRRAIQAGRLVTGPHMNYQGGSWSTQKLTERLECADMDWGTHDAGGESCGHYWVAYTCDVARAIVGGHRLPGDKIFTFRSFFADGVPDDLRIQIIAGALQVFQETRPDQARVWTFIRSGKSSDTLYSRSGFTFIGTGRMQRPDHRYRHVDIYTFDLTSLTARALSPERLDIWLSPAILNMN